MSGLFKKKEKPDPWKDFKLESVKDLKKSQFEYVFPVPDVPDHINADLKEAGKCLKVDAFKACVVMCRRVIERVCLDHEATGNILVKKIDDLHEKGFLSTNEKNLFHEVRFFGNLGAHPSFENTEIGFEEAIIVIELTDQTVKHVYQIPAKIKRLKEWREKK